MKCLLKVSFLFAFYFPLSDINAQEIILVSDPITVDQTWSPTEGVYYVSDCIVVEEQATLTIEPGTIIRLRCGVTVNGKIFARGTENDPIVFTSYSDDLDIIDSDNFNEYLMNGWGWGWISLLGDEPSEFIHCNFRSGGSRAEIGAIHIRNNPPILRSCSFTACGGGVSVDTDSIVQLNDLDFSYNISALIHARSRFFSINNSRFTNNQWYDIHNWAENNLDASQNWWDIEKYLLMIQSDTLINFETIGDQLDAPSTGLVNYQPPQAPRITVESVDPEIALGSEGKLDLLITGYLFQENVGLSLKKDSLTLTPTHLVYFDSFQFGAIFEFDTLTSPSGIFDVHVFHPELDTAVVVNGLKLLDSPSIPFGEWVPFSIDSSFSFSSAVTVPDVEKIFVLVKKKRVNNYIRTWKGLVRLAQNEELEEEEDSDFVYQGNWADIELQQGSKPGVTFFEVKSTDLIGDGEIIFTDSLPELVLESWTKGEILRPNGYDWKQLIVPPGTGQLCIRLEGYGIHNTLELFYETLHSERPVLRKIEQGPSINECLPNPLPGRYILRYKDSAVLEYDSGVPDVQQEQRREYLVYVGRILSDAPSNSPISITSLSSNQLGQSIATLEISGIGFAENDQVYLSRSGLPSIVASSKLLLEGKRVWQATFDLSDAEAGGWEVNVRNVLNAANYPLEIVPGELYDLSVNIISSSQIREGRWRPIVFEVKNKTNIDAYAVPLFIEFTGTPEFNNPELVDYPSYITDSIQGARWDIFEGVWNGWEDVPYFVDEVDSASGVNLRRLPVYIPRILANSTFQVIINVKYLGQGNIERVSAFTMDPIVDNRDIEFRTEAGECFIDLLIDFVMLTQGPSACYAGLYKSYKDASKIGNQLKEFDPIGLLGNLAGVAGSMARCYSLVNPSAKLISIVGKLYSVGKGLTDFYEDAQSCFEEINIFSEVFIEILGSSTPEDKFGLVGAEKNTTTNPEDKNNFINQTKIFPYRIDYWNKADASAPAAEVFIRDTLDAKFDPKTVKFTEIGLLGRTTQLEGGQYFNVNVDLRPEFNYIVNVEANVDPKSREILWTHRTLDPITLERPEDDLAGYLPPVDPEGRFIGWVSFEVNSLADFPSTTEFNNQAWVNFDGVGPWGQAPPYGPYINTFDFDPPSSYILPLAPEIVDTSFQVSWVSNDADGCGALYYDIYYSSNNEPITLWLGKTRSTSQVFHGKTGHTYYFYSVATDKVGNKEVFSEIPTAETSLITDLYSAKEGLSDQIKIIPNPANDLCTIELTRLKVVGQVTYSLSDSMGRTTKSGSFYSHGDKVVHQLDLSALPSGIYFLMANHEDTFWNTKLVKY